MKENRFKFSVAVLLVQILFNLKQASASALPSDDCKGNRQMLVKESINIDLTELAFRDAAVGADCYWTFEADDDTRILVFTAENLSQLQEFITVYDGLGDEDPELTLMNQEKSEKSRKDLPPSLYTTGPSALVRIDHAKLLAASRTLPINSLKLKVAKAAFCPQNLGSETNCGRVVDPESCYCATFTKRDWQGQKAFCLANNFTILTLDNKVEEQLIVAAFGGDVFYWTGANDIVREGFWIWDASLINLYPWGGGVGYANWAPGQPDTIASDEDCMEINFGLGWNDDVCTKMNNAICENQP